MTPRQYTVLEIDAMRKAILRQIAAERPLGWPGDGQGITEERTRDHREALQAEARLRTYIAAGVDPYHVINPPEKTK